MSACRALPDPNCLSSEGAENSKFSDPEFLKPPDEPMPRTWPKPGLGRDHAPARLRGAQPGKYQETVVRSQSTMAVALYP